MTADQKTYSYGDWNRKRPGIHGEVYGYAVAKEKADGKPNIYKVSYYKPAIPTQRHRPDEEISLKEAKRIDGEFVKDFLRHAEITLQSAIWHENAKDPLWAENYTAAAEEMALQSTISRWETENG